ncbi:hypothetical protein AK830_g4325 [Neonectria ditissima]|uniref:Major facilitator superfamily (MFS) profile domain-containing protein n=1 Tax=Neonectria ditissima TaxID=78410 RepID=A0A0P7BG98_9HYPO|nr:hypothetical protein AK830_g4325 [Neonectria ditissima]
MASPSPPAERPVTVGAAICSSAGAFSWLSNAGIVKLNLILVLPLISSYATGFDGSMITACSHSTSGRASSTTPALRSLAYEDSTPHEFAFLNAIQNVGQLVALPFYAIACDRFGRRPALVFSASVLLIGVALQGAAQNTAMFIAARGILGLGLALNITAAPLLLLELAYPRQQAPMVGLYNSLWSLGALSAAWITFGTFRIGSDWSWRIPSLLQGVSSVVQILLCWLIEESPRWLLSKGRDEEARSLIAKYHANGDDAEPLVTIEMKEIRTALYLEEQFNAATSYMSFFQTKGNRSRFFIILAVGFFSQWSGNGLISYYLTLILDSIGYKAEGTQTLINALMTVWGMIWSVFFSAIVNRFSRRTLFLTSTIGCLVVYIIWTALEATYEQQTALDGTGNGGAAKASGGRLSKVTYVVEILPFNMRARGLVLYNLFVALALIFNQYVNPIGVTNSGWKYYIMYDVWLAFEVVVVYFLFVETGNLSLEETAAVLDGEEYKDKLVEGAAANAEKQMKLQDEVAVR